MEEFRIEDIIIYFNKNQEKFEINQVVKGASNLSEYFIQESMNIQFVPKHEIVRPLKTRAIIPTEYKNKLKISFEIIDKVKKQNECFSGFLASHIYERMTALWNKLLIDNNEMLAIDFWREIVDITLKWETDNDKHIHKGSLYAFLAHTYLLVGQINTGFIYIYNAINDDIELNASCPFLNYPQEAPVYLTATLSPNPNNILKNFVDKIRKKLENYLTQYRIEFNSSFQITDLDTRFLQSLNPDLMNIRYFFVFTLWAIFDFENAVQSKLNENDFSKLKLATYMFSLCLVIDKLMNNLQKYKASSLAKEIDKYITDKGWMQQKEIFKLNSIEHFSSGDPDQLIPKLLSGSLQYKNSAVRKEIQYLCIAWNLRNFGGHYIQSKKVITEEFANILKVLLFDIFLIIEEY